MKHPSLPANPSLEFDRKQAKKLLDDVRSGNPAAIRRVRTHHPRFAGHQPLDAAALHDAQLVVAREYGFASWPRWKEFVEWRRLDVAQRASELVRAACSGNMRRASALLDAEPSLSSFDLLTAAACGDSESVARCLARDATLARSKGGPNDWEPIVYACFSRFLRSDVERASGIVQCVRLLLQHGADPNSHFFVGEGDERHLQSCLYAAAGIANNVELTRALFEAGARVAENDGEVLYHACEFRDVTCLRLVLEACPPPPAWRAPIPEDARHCPPASMVSYCLSRALDFDNEAAALLFLEHGADPNLRVPWHDGQSHMHKAAFNGRSLLTLSAMLDRGGDFRLEDGRRISPYRYAVRYAHQHLVTLFESRGADPNSATNEDRRLGAVMTGDSADTGIEGISSSELLSNAVWRNDTAVLRRLLDAGADPNLATGVPPLHHACWSGRLEAARLLIERGASTTTRNHYGGDAVGTTLHGSETCTDPEMGPEARSRDQVYAEILELLIEAGAPLPDRIHGGSDAVQEALRRHGVPDAD